MYIIIIIVFEKQIQLNLTYKQVCLQQKNYLLFLYLLF